MNKAIRMAKSVTARAKRKVTKSIITKRTTNMYAKLRRARKAKQ